MTSPPPDLTTQHVRRATNGDGASLSWVFERFSPLLLSQARFRLGPVLSARIDAEDVVAEAWLTALGKLGDLTPRDGRYTPVLLRFLAKIEALQRDIPDGLRSAQREVCRGEATAGNASMESIAISNRVIMSGYD